MTTIDPSQGLAAAVRNQLAALRERRVAQSARGTGAPAARADAHSVSAAMARRIQAIAADDPERPRKAVRIYLEAQLAREFGSRLVNDPAFPGMLDAVQQGLQQDEQTAAAVDALGRLLVAGKLPPA
jgi:hypothetical protein